MVGKLLILSFILILGLTAWANEPDYLSFEEIQSFTQSRAPNLESFANLNRILQGSFGETHKTTQTKLQETNEYQYIRVSNWNLERGLKLGQLKKIIRDPQKYMDELKLKQASKDKLKAQIQILQNSDIFTLNEVDWGIQRTKYRNVAKDFAEIFNANYLFAAEFIELSPQLLNDPNLDKSKYKGLHGNAIVSKFPIINSTNLRLPLCYDWFFEESKSLAAFEKLRRTSSSIVIKEEIISELRQGSRLALIADIELPNKDLITVISTHLENRTNPECREKQIQTILDFIKNNNNPVVLAGDLNNFEQSAEPTSVGKVVKNKVQDPDFLGKAGLNLINPYNLITNASASVLGFIRKHKNPTKAHIPVILPNKTGKLFSMIKNFQFADGNQFDLSGDSKWSYQAYSDKNRFSNSNQIAKVGFVETFQFKRAFGFAKYKIDWIFVKPGRRFECSDEFHKLDYDCKHYFPAFGQTLKKFNEVTGISDHNPITVELIL